jgi:hypothetical protein
MTIHDELHEERDKERGRQQYGTRTETRLAAIIVEAWISRGRPDSFVLHPDHQGGHPLRVNRSIINDALRELAQ